jgi:hypothetical protein
VGRMKGNSWEGYQYNGHKACSVGQAINHKIEIPEQYDFQFIKKKKKLIELEK